MPQTIRYIASMGIQDQRPEPRGVSLANVIRVRCGTLDPEYVAAMVNANLDYFSSKNVIVELQSLSSDVVISLPACGMSPQSTTIHVDKDLNVSLSAIADGLEVPLDTADIEKFFRRNNRVAEMLPQTDFNEDTYQALAIALDRVGQQAEVVAAERNFYAVLNAQTLKLQSFDPRRLQPGASIALPGSKPVASTISFPGTVSIEEVTRQLRSAAQLDGVGPGTVDIESVSLLGQCGGKAVAEGRWPFDVPRLEQVLALNRLARNHNHLEPPQEKMVLVVDTGFDPGLIGTTLAFPADVMESLKAEIPLRGRSSISQGSGVAGLNLANLLHTSGADDPGEVNDPTAAKKYLAWSHGIEVAGIALGGRQMESLRALMPLVRIAPVNMIDSLDLRPNPEVLADAIRVADENNASVIVTSMPSTVQIPGFAEAAKDHGSKIVYVAAAGNDILDSENNRELSEDIPGAALWPDMYGGSIANVGALPTNMAVITVGANDVDGAITPFSRYSRDFVDLLAPGCVIPTYRGLYLPNAASVPAAADAAQIQISPAPMNGTSAAAPLVAFVAALLSEEDMSPQQIKTRIQASVDEKDELKDKVWSSGILNPYKALAVRYDTIEYSPLGDFGNTVTVVGTVRNRSTINVCNGGYNGNFINKLTFRPKPGGGWALRIWKKGRAGEDECATPEMSPGSSDMEQMLDFNDASTNQQRLIPLRAVRDWIPPVWR